MATGIGMKMSISIISKKFESVTDISTDTLAKWIKYRSMPFEPAGNNTITGNQSTSGSENVTGSSSEHQVNEVTNATRKLVLLDCRPEEEFVISHLKGSVRVDFDKDLIEIIKTLPQDLQPVKNLGNTDIVCYCSIGYRSSTVADKFQKYMKANTASLRPGSEFPAVFNLEGSLFKWANESRHMVDIDGRTTTFAHPYNAMWGKLLNAELRKWTL
ncbi:uncharacterized protein LOC117332816 [Pecten maximus]|uniref:uncharacterized protein LOC117332816 n=1 Tax=Pecten maximus TaxID=6579 RepID=UPI001458726D|nr:uncharacterized protein LOC117332816 [Pecten maximus]